MSKKNNIMEYYKKIKYMYNNVEYEIKLYTYLENNYIKIYINNTELYIPLVINNDYKASHIKIYKNNQIYALAYHI